MGSPDTPAKPVSASDFTYEDINPNSPTHGQRLSLKALYAERGVVLNFLASWCGFCWKELPELEELQHTMATPIVGIAADEYQGPAVLLEMIRKAELSLPILLVPTADIKKMESSYDHQILPATYVIDRQGRVRSVFEGTTSAEMLRNAVSKNPED
jgi:thiol-disulfide isomerase/thioredoxin